MTHNPTRPFVAGLGLVGIALTFLTSIPSAQPPDPMLGKWVLNVAKSTYPTAPPKRMTVTIAAATRGWTLTVDSIGPKDEVQKWGYTSAFDGSESPVSGNPAVDAAVFKSTASGGVVQYKKNGAVVYTTSSAVSDDGKTMTVTAKVPLGGGKEVTIVSVYEKQ